MLQPDPKSDELVFRFRDLPRALWFFLAEERWFYLLFLLVLLAVMFYTLVPPLLIGMIANFLIAYGAAAPDARPAVSQLWWLVGVLAGSHAVVALVRLSSKRMLGRISLNARYRAKVWGFERLLDYSLAWHQQESTGNKAQRILTGSESVREWTGDMVNSLSSAVAAFVGSLIACMLLHPAFILFFAYYLGILLSVEFYFDYRIAKLSDRINKSMENASGSFVESASNILAVKALGAADNMTSNVARREELARQLSYERLRLSNTKWMCFQIHNSIAWGAFLLVIGWMVMQGALLAGFFLTYAAYFDRLREASIEFTDKIQLMIERKSNLGRMMSIFWGCNTLAQGKARFPTEWDAIRLKNASFRYGDKPAVGPMTLDIPRGSVLGIAGHSGSGKSTLIKLMLGLYHLEHGSLSIGTTPVAEIRHEALTSKVAVVLQETELFNFSLKENLTMMREVSAELLARACRIACLDELIARLPEGLDTSVGEKGHALSGGERQRVGIARAICRDAPILLMDEATSALDSATEQQVTQRLMNEFAPGRTLIIVAHRISTLREADQVVVFEQGQIVEQGRFAELAADPATHFGRMVAIQAA
ncbi:ABC transporter ATP-binding protein [Uliginosibacterium aquaticum]|uniref:ABC transporter ATP-binding protein n=1 Tax=Uliginosibacterium aquaticum TaxID=2731212 RepID=A0ABX2IIS7_9RHOO|nr:ABC transporter ATP-binding protein [Uliginosibacterium aquaticum]NSL56684.1 ABC transporter ATP-binding protein [Uliginosibacterium aquaticum]